MLLVADWNRGTPGVENIKLGYNARQNFDCCWEQGSLYEALTPEGSCKFAPGYLFEFKRSVSICQTLIGSEACKCWSRARCWVVFSFRCGSTRLPLPSKIVRRQTPQRCRRTWRI